MYSLNEYKVEAGQNVGLAKAHKFRSTANYVIQPGTHSLAIQVNGRRFSPAEFEVVE